MKGTLTVVLTIVLLVLITFTTCWFYKPTDHTAQDELVFSVAKGEILSFGFDQETATIEGGDSEYFELKRGTNTDIIYSEPQGRVLGTEDNWYRLDRLTVTPSTWKVTTGSPQLLLKAEGRVWARTEPPFLHVFGIVFFFVFIEIVIFVIVLAAIYGYLT